MSIFFDTLSYVEQAVKLLFGRFVVAKQHYQPTSTLPTYRVSMKLSNLLVCKIYKLTWVTSEPLERGYMCVFIYIYIIPHLAASQVHGSLSNYSSMADDARFEPTPLALTFPCLKE